MNESILAYHAWHGINKFLYFITWDYFDKHTDADWGDNYLREIADKVCENWEMMEPVLEWLEKKFE